MLRTLSGAPSRREALRLTAGSAIGLLAGFGRTPVHARNAVQECKTIKHRKKRGRCKKRANQHNARHDGANPMLPAPPTPPAPPAPDRPLVAPPTCTDGMTNGSESDVDCGGSCPRCENTRSCTSQDDCRSALCVSGVCQACAFDTECGIDADGACLCQTHNGATQERVCTSRVPGNTGANCDHCTGDLKCIRTGLGDYTCFKPCGAA